MMKNPAFSQIFFSFDMVLAVGFIKSLKGTLASDRPGDGLGSFGVDGVNCIIFVEE